MKPIVAAVGLLAGICVSMLASSVQAVDPTNLTPEQRAKVAEARELNLRANRLGDEGKNVEAEKLARKVLEIDLEILGENNTDTATALNNLGLLAEQDYRYQEAEAFYQRALKTRVALLGPDHLDVAVTLLNVAGLDEVLGRYEHAEKTYSRVLTIYTKVYGPNHLEVGHCLNDLGLLYDTIGKYAQAQPLLERSLKIKYSQLGWENLDVATAMHNLGFNYLQQGKYDSAEELFQAAIKVREKKLGPNHPSVATCLSAMDMLYSRREQYEKAEPLARRALQILENANGPNHPSLPSALNNLGQLVERQGKHSEARQLYERALKIREDLLGPDHPDLCAFLNNLGELNCALGKYDQAEAFLQRAMKIRKAALGPDDPDVALSAENLSGMFAASGRWREAANSFDDARRVIRRHIAHVLPALSPAEQQSFLQQTDEGEFCSCISMGVQKRDDPSLVELSTGWLLNGKAVAQEALAQNAQLTRDSADPNTAEIVKQLLEVRRQLASLVYSGPQKGREQDRKIRVDELQVQEAELARQIAQAHGEHFQSDPWIELGAVRKAIPGDAVLVDIAKFDKFDFQAKGPANKYRGYRYAAWIVPPAGQGNVRIIDLGDANQIDAAIKAVGIEMRRAIQQLGTKGKAFDYVAHEQAMQSTLDKLAELALTPVLKEIPEGTKQLIISPDSHLWLAPWAALPLADGRYAIEQFQIRYSISGRDLIVRQTDGQKSTPPVVMADPNYDLLPGDVDKNTRNVLRGAELASRGSAALRSAVGPMSTSSALPKVRRLPGTKAEADAIVPKIASYTHTDPTVYTDRWALEGVFKKVHGPRLLVLSTHGFFLPDQEAKLDHSASDDSRSAGPALTVGGEPIENPLLRCGLLLAGCNSSGQQTAKSANANAIDDGILTGMEIIGADLRGTELVVLSACETALGQVQNGEGVSGLRQAFQLAGAESVVATLWQISDADSAAIMAQFFDGISEHQPKAEALRQAQLARIEALRQRYGAAHPFFWAAFTLTGE